MINPKQAPAQTALTPYEKKTQEIATIFSDRAKAIADALPPGSKITPTWFTQFSLQAAKSEQLRECSALSIYESCLEAATLGLLVGGSLAHAYLVAYNCKVGAGWEKRAQLQLGYRGMVELLRRSGSIARGEARAVFKGDEFRYSFGLHPDIVHVPGQSTAAADLTHAYFIAHFADGTAQFDVMTREEILAIMGRSKSIDKKTGDITGPWSTDPVEMAKKTVVRRCCKLLPMSPDVQRAIENDDERTVDVKAHARVLNTFKPGELPAESTTDAPPSDDAQTVNADVAPEADPFAGNGGMSDDEKAAANYIERIEAAEALDALESVGQEIANKSAAVKALVKGPYIQRKKALEAAK